MRFEFVRPDLSNAFYNSPGSSRSGCWEGAARVRKELETYWNMKQLQRKADND